jgi:hypothetical protein
MDIKDSQSLGKEVGKYHKLMCLILKEKGLDSLIVSKLSDYVIENKEKLTK